MSHVNERVAVWLTQRVGSMWAAYAFCCIALISLPSVLTSGSALIIVAWVAQTFLQLVLLPVIMVGQDVQSRRTEATINDTHTLAQDEHEQTRSMVKELADSHRDIQVVLEDMRLLLAVGER